MLTIVADTCGRHDTLGGACAQESNTVRYALDKRFMHACRDNFCRPSTHDHAHGMSKRDITHNINFFMNVPVTPSRQADLRGRHLGPGQVRGDARRDGCDLPDLQLPAAEQSLQCVQPDSDSFADLG